MEAQNCSGASPSGRRRRQGKNRNAQDDDALVMFNGGNRGGGKGTLSEAEGVVHHRPPKETAADVGFPIRGGQTLLIAYFPWEASESDIENEFAKFARVKRVHLVVDKSSRKPRCFGFVKFVSKGDAEEALRATMLGMVQLLDTRGHVWHLKAEWTKSGDMVVDDSETEQEVAKRKEERKTRVDSRGSIEIARESGKGQEARSKNGRWPPPPKVAFHHGAPAPLLPVQARYPPVPTPHGLQGPMPMLQAGQGQLGLGPPGVPPLLPHPAAAPLGPAGPPQQHDYGLAVQQSLPMYSGYGAQTPAAPPYPVGLPGTSPPGVAPRAPLAVPDPVSAGMPQPHLRELLGGASGYGAPHQAYNGGYPPPGGYGPPPPPLGGYQGYPPGQPPYASQHAAAAAASYAGHQAPYGPAPSPQAYPVSPQQEAYAATSSAYPPAYAPQQGIASQPGYASPPPSYASQAPGYAQHLVPQSPGYGPPPPNYATGAYAVGQPGVLQPAVPVAHGGASPSAYGYSAHMSPQTPPPASATTGNYPGHMPPATGLLPHPAQGQQMEEVLSGRPNSAVAYASPGVDQTAVMAAAASSAASATTVGGIYGSPDTAAQAAISMAAMQNGVAAQMMMVPNTQAVQSPASQPPAQAPQHPMLQHPDAGDSAAGPSMTAVQAALQAAAATSVAPNTPNAAGQEYLQEMFVHFNEMPMHDKNNVAAVAVPAPPTQQPPAPPTMQVPPVAGQWPAESFREASAAIGGQAASTPQGPQDWNLPATAVATVQPVQPPRPGGGPASLWNFDDAAAKGLVDGLVGDDGIQRPPEHWTAHGPQA